MAVPLGCWNPLPTTGEGEEPPPLSSRFHQPPGHPPTEAEAGEWRHVTRVIDGDTLILDGGERVRLIGVDAPETVHPQRPVEYFGKEASAFTRRTVEGKQVRLEYEQGAPREDRYGRTLGYVYLEDGRLLNLEIIAGGYGHAYTRFPFSKMEEFRAAERQARETGEGLWGSTHGNWTLELDAGLAGRSPAAEEPGVLPGPEDSMGSCIPADQCCRVCSAGQACGNSCISRSYTCRKGRGCACDAAEVCP
jgi:micrococcal nuclease